MLRNAPFRFPFILLLTAAPLLAAPAPSARLVQDEVAKTSARLDALCEKLEAARAQANVPGMAVCVVKGDEVVLLRGFGIADVEKKTPVTVDTVFPIGSSSKPLTSTLIAMMVSEGKMDFDDPVTDYLPEFKLKIDTDDVEAQVTIRDLLSHQTGIVDGPVLAELFSWWKMDGTIVENPKIWTRDDFLSRVVELEATFPFRETHSYSNSSMVAAAMASGVAAETDWDSLMMERMFKPLGMKSSNTLFEKIRKDPQLATGYLNVDDGLLALPYYSLDSVSPAGGIASSIRDLSQWLRLLTGKGQFEGKQLIDESELEEIWAEHIEAHALRAMIPGVSYGMGWMTHEWNDHIVVEHGGNGYGFAATVCVLPELDLACALLSNNLQNPLQVGLGPLVWEALIGTE
jgi:CubicO group peptidase (beta-lactamase class C family)